FFFRRSGFFSANAHTVLGTFNQAGTNDIALQVLADVVIELATTRNNGERFVRCGSSDFLHFLRGHFSEGNAFDVLDCVLGLAAILTQNLYFGTFRYVYKRPEDSRTNVPIVDVAAIQHV